jgi:hypothetical protein
VRLELLLVPIAFAIGLVGREARVIEPPIWAHWLLVSKVREIAGHLPAWFGYESDM